MHKFFSMYLFLVVTLYMFRVHSAHHQERHCINTACGNSHSVLVAEMCAVWKKRICASRWSFTKNHYMMHGQQNVKGVICFKNNVFFRTCGVFGPTKSCHKTY